MLLLNVHTIILATQTLVTLMLNKAKFSDSCSWTNNVLYCFSSYYEDYYSDYPDVENDVKEDELDQGDYFEERASEAVYDSDPLYSQVNVFHEFKKKKRPMRFHSKKYFFK